MASDELQEKIATLVDVLRSGDGTQVSLTDIASVTEVLLGTMRSYFDSVDAGIYQEVRILSEVITRARQDIASLRPKKMTSERLPRAGLELEAITKATEDATNTIMEAAEEIMAAEATYPDDYATKINDACMRIFEACSFQDITGQRVTKVVNTLTFIEERLDQLNDAWKDDHPEDSIEEDDGLDRLDDGHLLNGPQLEGEGVDQSGVDELMAGGDDQASPEPKKKTPKKAAKKSEKAVVAAGNGSGSDDQAGDTPTAPPQKTDDEDDSSQADIDALFD